VTVKTSNASDGTALVAGVTAQIPAGKVTCVLGPSGCGKSILLDAIRGRAAGLNVSGSIFINGIQVKDLTKYSSIIGFVPQDDIIDRSLTVGELLWYNARCRLPREYSDEKVHSVIDRVLNDLNIARTRNVVIGGGANAAANISGGQVKRVNIAMELVAEPNALFLDGPTNGLDATAALDLIKTLDGIAKTGVTIVVIAQQPRVEVFEAMGHLLLLATNQKHSIAYEGEPAKAVDYFCQLNPQFVFPEHLNPADWLLDVLSGDAHEMSEATAVDFGARWAATAIAYTPNPALPVSQAEALETRQSASFWQVMRLTIVTSTFTRLRDRSSLITFTLLHVIMALAMASGFSPMIQGSPRSSLNPTIHPSLIEFCPPILRERCKVNMQDLGLQQLLFFMSMSVGAASSMAAIKLYGGHLPVLKRMVDANFPVYAVGIGRLIADLVTLAMNTFLFVAVWMLTGNSGSWVDWLGTITLCGFAAGGIGYIASLVTGVSNAGVICMAAVICFSVFSGVEPTLTQVSSLNIAALPWYVSFGTWTAEASYYAYTKWLQVDRNVQAGADKFGFEVSDGIGRSLGALAAIGIGYRIITLVLLHRLTAGPTRFWGDVGSIFRKQPSPSTNTATVAPNQPHSRWYNVYMPQAPTKLAKQVGASAPVGANSA
jgi:ABC-type multidrug transport system ATPase subunit